MTRILVILLFIVTITTRPGILGEHFTILGLTTCGIALYLCWIENILTRKFSSINVMYVPIIVLIFLYWSYIMFQTVYTRSTLSVDSIKGFATTVFITFVTALLLSRDNIAEQYGKLFIRSMIVLVISYIITFILSRVVPLDKLLLFHINVYDDAKYVYFPITPIYGAWGNGHLIVQRLLGLFRESGISQAFMVWAYVSLDYYKLNTKLNKLLLVLGIFFTFSTAGIAVFISTIILKWFLNGRKLLSLILLPTIYFGIMYMPFIGIADKMKTHGTSITDRITSMKYSFDLFYQYPFGVGLGNSQIKDSAITLLTSISMIGVVGFLLICAVYFFPLAYVKNKRLYFLSIFPLFVTALFSQPISDAPVVMMIILLSFYQSNTNESLEISKAKKTGIKIFKKRLVWKKYKLSTNEIRQASKV